ncbi:hypothetical protein EV102420_21_00660 [Pseudescherichia vulneris NBRC 102420]|uniref:Uncharacterized protein n=1 Tax=Pseudescherichia vulneris NBRC 102420 TaxID=1115515 RepID=A0A090V4A1_PSEVU|nr:hypothetical protein [Pseudescherichia vulneris]GAL59631.1 hypothetical protein EV102420_21_00660 [Pseudescherichia vulneris NBRC 102420]STQ59616.1 Uncharacterised protein [Pseudescherichia vulneris]
MMRYIKKSLALSAVITKKMATNELQRLELLKDRLKSRLGAPVGIYMTGIPLGISMILAVACYAMPQVSVWMLLFSWLNLPEYKVLMGVFFAAVVYCVVIMSAMLLTARGSLIGYKLYLAIIALTGMIAVVYFIYAWSLFVFGSIDNYTPQITSALGLGFLCLNVMWMNSSIFYRSIVLALHNRIWRKQLKIDTRHIAGV